MDKEKAAELLKKLTGINLKLSKLVEGETVETKLATKDGKEIVYKGELKEGVEVKCGDQTLNGTIELADDRKMVVAEGKFVKFEAVEVEDKSKAEIVELKATVEAIKAENVQLKADLKTATEAAQETLKAVEVMAKALEKEPAPAGGGNGEEVISKAEFIHKRMTEGK